MIESMIMIKSPAIIAATKDAVEFMFSPLRVEAVINGRPMNKRHLRSNYCKMRRVCVQLIKIELSK